MFFDDLAQTESKPNFDIPTILEHDWQDGTDLTRSDQCHPANHVLWFVDQNNDLAQTRVKADTISVNLRRTEAQT